MNIIQTAVQNLMRWAYSGNGMDAGEVEITERQKEYNELINYYKGKQRLPLTVKNGKNYNVIAGLCGVVIDRSTHMLIGGGVEFEFPAEESGADDYIENVWAANKKAKKLLDLSQFGSIYGTEFIKIVPGALEHNGTIYPRLVMLNPYNVGVITANDDIDNVLAYIFRWNDGDAAMREITEKSENGTAWVIRTEKADNGTHGKWVQVGPEVLWGYPFPPIAHEKNLPNSGNVYGQSDIERIIELQDHYNASNSDIRVILNNFAFPLRYVSGGKLPRVTLEDGTQVVDINPAKILEFNTTDTKMGTAEAVGDMSASRNFSKDIRADLFDISATVDGETLRQNASQLTNFGLKVMYKDEIAKNQTKQMLYGDLLTEVNRRLLIMAGLGDDGGKVVFGDPLPVNDAEAIAVFEKEKALGIVSVETIAKRRGYDWESEKKKIADEKKASDSLGGNLLRDFMAGRGLQNQQQPAALAQAQMTKQQTEQNVGA